VQDAEQDAAFRGHGKVRALFILGDWMAIACSFHQIEKVIQRSNLFKRERFHRKVAQYDHDSKGVHVVSQEGGFDAADKGV
jgi:hypothetical protein